MAAVEVNVNGPQWCDPTLLATAIKFLFKINHPWASWSRPGLGKTEIAITSALSCKIPVNGSMVPIKDVILFRVGYYEPQDIGGFPTPGPVRVIQADGKLMETGERGVRMLLMERMPLASRVGDRPIFMYLDEIDRVQHPAIFNSLTEILLDRKINGEPLGPNVVIGASGNGASDKGTFPLPDAVASRMIHLYLSMDGTEAFDSWADYTLARGGSSQIVRFMRANEQAWSEVGAFDKSKMIDYSSRNARSITRMAWIKDQLDALRNETGKDIADLERIIMSGGWGYKFYQMFKSFEMLDAQCPSKEEVMADPRSAQICEDPAVLIAFGWDLAAWMERRQKTELNTPGFTKDLGYLIAYVKRWPDEARAAMFKTLERRVKSMLLHPGYADVLKKRGL